MSGLATVLVGIDPFLEAIINSVNPLSDGNNCGHIIDAVYGRLTGKNSGAVAPSGFDGTFPEIEKRFNTTLNWGKNFQSAFDAVREGGDGTTAIVGINYSGGNASHVVVLTNRGGTVAIIEGQNWGANDDREVNTSPERANERYNADGGSTIGWGIVH